MIGIIGFGNLGKAIAEGFIASGRFKGNEISIFDLNVEKKALAGNMGLKACKSPGEAIANSSYIFLCTKPGSFEELLSGIGKEKAKGRVFISAAAGISLNFLEKNLDAKFVRIMPIIACATGSGLIAASFSKKIGSKDRKAALELLSSLGFVFEATEEELGLTTALSGSGVAYYAYLIDAFAKAAVEHGLDERKAYFISEYAALGAAGYMLSKKVKGDEVISKVASKGGTTEKGIESLNESQVSNALKVVFDATYKKTKEMGK